MISRESILLIVLLTVLAGNSHAAPPTDDNFADRIVLTGTSITFTGTLAEATVQNGWLEFIHPGWPTQSVWWEWTAPESTAVTFQILDDPLPLSWSWYDRLLVYTNNCNGFPTNWDTDCPGYGYHVGEVQIRPGAVREGFSFLANGGQTYFLTLIGYSGSTYIINLTATNPPIILEQPKTQTVPANGSTFLAVLARGILPLSYQWRRNGADLPGAMNPILAIDVVTNEAEGSYCVMVSNATGVATSTVANLIISRSDVPPSLASSSISSTNRFSFILAGETGRYYRIESSTNLLNWSPEKSFSVGPSPPYQQNLVTSVIFNSDASSSLSIPATSARKFVRASRYAPANEICNNNLRKIRFAKEIWAMEQHKVRTDYPANTDIYSSRFQEPICPLGGYYMLNKVDSLPVCSIPEHVLEEPR